MLDRSNMTITQMIDARKSALAGEDAWNFLAGFNEIVVAKGKTCVVFNPARDSKETILSLALGRSGTLRAPALQVGNRLLVGYNETLLAQYLG